MQDWQLLQEYVRDGSEAAFAHLAERHASLVYGTCLREVRDPALAEDVTQVVFLLLARKAAALREGTVLAGWLFNTARFAAKNALKQEARRRHSEEKAAADIMTNLPEADSGWQEIEPLLHGGLAALNGGDRDAVLLRFFEGRSLKETGQALGITEDAARMRVARAVEKLRRHFARHGFVVPAAALAALLTSHAAQAAPAACLAGATVAGNGAAAGAGAGGVANGALAGGKVSVLYGGAVRAMAVAKLKVAAVAVMGAALAGAGGVSMVRLASKPEAPTAVLAAASAPAAQATVRRANGAYHSEIPTLVPRAAVVASRQITKPRLTRAAPALEKEPVQRPVPRRAGDRAHFHRSPHRRAILTVAEKGAYKAAASPAASAVGAVKARTAAAPEIHPSPVAAAPMATPPAPVAAVAANPMPASVAPAAKGANVDAPGVAPTTGRAKGKRRLLKRGKPRRGPALHGRVTEINESASTISIRTPGEGLKTIEVPSATSISVDQRTAGLGDVQTGMNVVIRSSDGQTAASIEARPKRKKADRPDVATRRLRRLLRPKAEAEKGGGALTPHSAP